MSSHAALLYAKLLVLERCHIGCTMKTEPQPERQEKVASTTLPAPSSETQSEEGTCCKVKEFLSDHFEFRQSGISWRLLYQAI